MMKLHMEKDAVDGDHDGDAGCFHICAGIGFVHYNSPPKKISKKML